MFVRAANDTRPYHFGPLPMETLPRDARIIRLEKDRPALATSSHEASPPSSFIQAVQKYQTLFDSLASGVPASKRAPVTDDLDRRTMDVKGGGYFLNASQIGICRIPSSGWLESVERPDHAFAIVIVVEHGRQPEASNLASRWVEGGLQKSGDLRAGEIACCLAGYIRHLGFAAKAHSATQTDVDLDRLAVLAGTVVRRGDKLVHPILDARFSLAVVTTEYELAQDTPLAADVDGVNGLHYWFGINGAESGRERRRRERRATHLSRYPMEQVRRVTRPTTLIIDEEVPRVPKRAAFFARSGR